MENREFNKIISFDENTEFERVNEKIAVEYFLNCCDEDLKKVFLDKFDIYIKKGLNSKVYTNNTMQDLMFIIFYLYDDPYSLLVQFNRLVEETNGCYTDYYDIINFDNLDKRENQYRYIRTIREMVSDIEISKSYSDLSLSRDFKDKLIKYRDDIEFNKRKNSFLNEYGELDIEELKISFDYYMSKEYMDNGLRRKSWGFLQGAYSSDRCNRYEIYRQAYTYSLKIYGDDKTKELFNCKSGSKYIKAICNGIDLNDYLSIKKLIGLDKTTQCNIYDLSLMLFGSTKYYSCLEDLFKKANSSLEKDFEPIIAKYKKDEIDCLIESVDYEEFLRSNCRSIKEYCNSKNISVDLFKKGLSYLKDEVMLKQIEEKKQRLASTRFAIVNSRVDRIVDYMMNGVPLDNNTTREFDYLDYKLMTKLELDEFKKLACDNGNANANIVGAVSRFIRKNKNVRKTNIQSILNAKNIVGYGTDNEHEITDEEKLATIEYLRYHHLVSNKGIIDSKVYNIAIKRYLVGTLFTEEEKDKIKNKY